jgi:hypothetical protein
VKATQASTISVDSYTYMPRGRREPLKSRGGAEAEIHRHLARFGVSGPGRDWCLRALHPASEKASPGLPDESSTFVLRPDFRIASTIMPPAGAGQWDCFMWIPPGDCNALYYATGPSPVDFSTPVCPNGVEVGVIQLQSQTVYSDVSKPYNVQYGAATTEYLTNIPSLRAAAFRHQFKSVTVEQIASAVSDQGQVYAGQFSPLLRTVGLVTTIGYDSAIVIPGSDPPANFGLIAQHYTTILPTDEASLSRMNPDFYQAPSREGLYMPLRLSGPAQPFARSTSGQCVHEVDGAAGFLSQGACEAPIGALLTPESGALEATPSVIPWPFRAVTNQQVTVPGGSLVALPGRLVLDTGYDHMNVGVAIFRGLQGGTQGSFGASLQVKVIAGLEIAPTPGQGDAVFAERPAPYEPRAMEAYYKLCLELKGTYPARYNSFEDILDAISDVASKVWNNVEPALVGGLSSLATSGIGMLSNAVGRRMGMLGGRAGSTRVTYRAPSAARSASAAASVRSAKPRMKARVKAR